MHSVRCATYLTPIFRPESLLKVSSNLIKGIEDAKLDFTTIAFTGFSGAMIAPIICLHLNKYPLLVRKENDNSHSGIPVEGPTEDFNYIIIDDLISTGNTIKSIVRVARAQNANLKGIFLYNQYDPSVLHRHTYQFETTIHYLLWNEEWHTI